MHEWHLTPEYITENWSSEKLVLMIDKLVERKQRTDSPKSNTIPEEQFFKQAGIKVVKHGN